MKDNFLEQIIATRPDKHDVGSCPPWKLRHLYRICKALNPNLIIESGTWKGNSLWLFKHAFHNAIIHAYDIDFSNRLFIDDSIYYHEHDIENHNHYFKYHFINNTDLIFFDDHINQEKRLHWAFKNGFKHIIFDDNIPLNKIDLFGAAPIPTLEMLKEINKLPDFIAEYKILDYDGSHSKGRNGGQTYLTYVKLKS